MSHEFCVHLRSLPLVPIRMNVCLVTGEYPPMAGGVGDYTALLGGALAQRGVSATVLTSTRASGVDGTTGRRGDGASPAPAAPSPTRPVAPSTPARVVPRVAKWDFGCWAAIEAARQQASPEIIHIQYQAGAYDLHPAVALWPLRARLRRRRPKIVVTFHDLRVPYLFPKAGPLRRLVVDLLAASADFTIVTNAEDASRLHAVDRRHLTLIPIGSNIPVLPTDDTRRRAVRERLGVARDELVIGYFGFLTPSKGVDLLLQALRELRRKGRRVRLVMVGGAGGESAASDRRYDQAIRAAADTPELRGHVTWTGFTEAEEVSHNLQALDLCALPFREGASFRHGTLIAALTHGLPIVTTRTRSCPRFADEPALVDGLSARLVPPGDVSALTAALDELLADPAQREALAAEARLLADYFSWDCIAQRTLAVYRRAQGS
ncbi:MAG: glycosyltransferase [Chloroflexi bacterium]|nr:glycosyltransferase [Chloroflexota bacterium]